MNFELDEVGRSLAALGVAIFILLLGVVLVLIAFRYGIFSYRETQIYVQIMGVFATVVLVAVYLQSIYQQRREETRRRESRLYEDMIREVVQPAIEIVDENKKNIETIDWAGDGDPALETISRDIGADAAEIDRFASEHSDVYRKMENHDAKLQDLVSSGSHLHFNIKEYIKKSDDVDTFWRTKYDPANLAVRFLNVDFVRIGVEHYGEWSELRAQIEGEFSEDLEVFEELQDEYENICWDLSNELRAIRDDLRTEYGLTIESVT